MVDPLWSCAAGPGRLVPRSPLGSIILAVTVAVALPLSVSLVASLLYLIRGRLHHWLSGARLRRASGAQVLPLLSRVYTVPFAQGRASTASGVRRRGQSHSGTAKQNGLVDEVGNNGRRIPNGMSTPQQNEHTTNVLNETQDGLLASDDASKQVTSQPAYNEPADGPPASEAVTAPLTSTSAHEPPDGMTALNGSVTSWPGPPASDAVTETVTPRPVNNEPADGPQASDAAPGEPEAAAGQGSGLGRWPLLAVTLALYVLCGALALGMGGRLEAGSALLAALLAVTGCQLPALAGLAAAAGLIYALIGMTLTALLCARLFSRMRVAAASGL